MALERTTVRRARKDRPCDDGGYCSGDEVIHAGDLYNTHVAGPGYHDWGEVSHWRRLNECGPCAAACGRPITRGAANA